jgi:hypothetical protein
VYCTVQHHTVLYCRSVVRSSRTNGRACHHTVLYSIDHCKLPVGLKLELTDTHSTGNRNTHTKLFFNKNNKSKSSTTDIVARVPQVGRPEEGVGPASMSGITGIHCATSLQPPLPVGAHGHDGKPRTADLQQSKYMMLCNRDPPGLPQNKAKARRPQRIQLEGLIQQLEAEFKRATI